MKKTIQKPENWQDFETLCKKLWGEVWNIPMKIKKNGRNGQSQAGVDVYGVPKGETNYWGIQCKGKDDYANAKLTKAEIEREIDKAKTFSPKLSVFIIATTMNKDAEIEAYVREKDLESRHNNGFEILLFCWEDIADLIDENQDTYNFWVANKQHKTRFEFEVYLNEFKTDFTIRPKCIRTIKRYRLKDFIDKNNNTGIANSLNNPLWMKNFISPTILNLTLQKINEAICSFEIIMVNSGSVVIEDWKLTFTVKGEHKEIMDQLGTGPMGVIDINFLKYKRTYVDKNNIFYSPKENEPLIQKDNRFFKAYIIPECREYSIPIEWELLARDFNTTGTLILNVLPEYEDEFVFEDVESEYEIKNDEIINIIEKKNYTDEN